MKKEEKKMELALVITFTTNIVDYLWRPHSTAHINACWTEADLGGAMRPPPTPIFYHLLRAKLLLPH